jgi:hypothetical protein
MRDIVPLCKVLFERRYRGTLRQVLGFKSAADGIDIVLIDVLAAIWDEFQTAP